MDKWRIHRLKINGFKIFFDFDETYHSNLVVYDGPNGFGKTSLFDAKQLLFCNKLPRVVARVGALKIAGNKKFSKSLYQNHNSTGDISIAVELKRGHESLFVMRQAKANALRNSSNKPNSFADFKLFELKGFDNEDGLNLIHDENTFWSEKLGDKFLSNFSVLNYLPQDSKSIVIPDKCGDDKSRTSQIEHLINLDGLKRRLDHIFKLKSANRLLFKEAKKAETKQKEFIEELEKALTRGDTDEATYEKLTRLGVTPQWDIEQPFSKKNFKDLHNLVGEINLLETVITSKDEIVKRVRNRQKIEFTNRAEFALAVRLFNHFEKIPELSKQKKHLDELKKLCGTLQLDSFKLSPKHAVYLSAYLDKSNGESLQELLAHKNKLLLEQGGMSAKQTDILQLRDKLVLLTEENDLDCPLCGHDYKERELLIEAVESKTHAIQKKLDGVGQLLAKCYQDIAILLTPLKEIYLPSLEKIKSEFNGGLYIELIAHEHEQQRLKKIGERLIALGIDLPRVYVSEEQSQAELVSKVKETIMKSLESEDEKITDLEMSFYLMNFESFEELNQLSMEKVNLKRQYIYQQHNKAVNTSILAKKKELSAIAEKVRQLDILSGKFDAIETKLKYAQTEYMNRTIGQMESLFHIYSGRLLQNCQSGLGVFIDMPGGARKNAVMNFTTIRDTQHDATLSMSSGQISALSLSLFLALNKKYAKTAFMFIDDPTQCMDEINIASLSDLLRVELRDRQVIISTHEQDISDYLCYRYGKAGLSRQQINLLEKSKQSAS